MTDRPDDLFRRLPITFTQHARHQMAERKLAEDTIKNAVEHCSWWARSTPENRYKLVLEQGEKSFTVVVIAIDYDGDIPVQLSVLTAYWTKRRPK